MVECVECTKIVIVSVCCTNVLLLWILRARAKVCWVLIQRILRHRPGHNALLDLIILQKRLDFAVKLTLPLPLDVLVEF